MPKKSFQTKIWIGAEKIFDLASSLKLAVLVILSLAIGLATATILESLHDIATAQYWVYRALWFHLLLAFLGVNILCVAVSRFPWKRSHIPFLLAHLGILILLAGSWITERFGSDGNLRITEGESASIVELDQSSFVITDQDQVFSVPVPWLPPDVKFKPISTERAGLPFSLQVDQFLSHAEPEVSFIPHPEPSSSKGRIKSGALKIHLVGGPMKISQDLWLFSGAPNWRDFQAGPARFFLSQSDIQEEPFLEAKKQIGKPWIGFSIQRDGSLKYLAQSSTGQRVSGSIKPNQIAGRVIHPGWKGDVTLTLSEWIPDATVMATYQRSRIQDGPQAPSSAIHVVNPQGIGVWLGLGDRATLHTGAKELTIGYFPRRILLPFSVRLDRFTVEHDPGTNRPASYASKVTVMEGENERAADISMNEPMEVKGFSIYQASYEDALPRPVTSIFSVNRDPGRTWKYLGSLLIVLGSILLFVSKYRKKRASSSVS